MTTMSIAEARNGLADAINRVSYGGERVLFARRGKPVAALVSPDDLERLNRIDDAADLLPSRKALREYERNPESAIPLETYLKARGKKS